MPKKPTFKEVMHQILDYEFGYITYEELKFWFAERDMIKGEVENVQR